MWHLRNNILEQTVYKQCMSKNRRFYTLTCKNSYKDVSYHRTEIGGYKIIGYRGQKHVYITIAVDRHNLILFFSYKTVPIH